MSFFVPREKEKYYAQNKVTKYYFHSAYGVLHGLLYDSLYHCIEIRRTKLSGILLAIQCFTVCQIVPVITLFATLVHNGLSADWFCQWIQLAVICFPMALCAQVFFVGPLVRFVFRRMFRKQLANG